MAVPVVTIICQVAEKPKYGPDAPQTTIKAAADIKIVELPAHLEIFAAKAAKDFSTCCIPTVFSLTLITLTFFNANGIKLFPKILCEGTLPAVVNSTPEAVLPIFAQPPSKGEYP